MLILLKNLIKENLFFSFYNNTLLNYSLSIPLLYKIPFAKQKDISRMVEYVD
ncbi:hypothetical protein NEOC65_001036 [Neochlamydia sp. AcF65]|nr:hypothetical protein [Neochlamydia sp. AcF65]MBS4169837.1 hypothetical protein [Neochlamydia sp. AcF95]NGY95932.1 hypothetical protein [Neochlamydia sp. AcF84]